jgi:hypothetical protein
MVVNWFSYLWMSLHLSLSTSYHFLHVQLIMSDNQIYVLLKLDTVHQEYDY